MSKFTQRPSLGPRWLRTLTDVPKYVLLLGAGVAFAETSNHQPEDPVETSTNEAPVSAPSSSRHSQQFAAVEESGSLRPLDDIADVVSGSSGSLRMGDPIPMSAVARVTLRVLGYSELSGEYAIDAGTISIPGVGRFDVSRNTIGELEVALSARMSEVFRRDISQIAVSIEVSRYAPYFVTGQVAQPGETAWRPGLTIIQAVALAGGERGDQTASAAGTAATLRQAQTQLMFSLAELERLNAEKHELKGYAPSNRLNETATQDSPELNALAHRQAELLHERRVMIHTQIDALRKARDSALALVESTGSQLEAVEQQLKLARSIGAGLKKLFDKKLVTNTRYMEQQGDVASLEARLAEMRGLVEVARSRVITAEVEITTYQQQRLDLVNERIETVYRETAIHESTITSITSGPATQASTPAMLEYNITRVTDGVVETIPAHIFTKVMPGDLIIVSPRPTDPQMSASIDGRRLNAVSAPMRETIARTERLIASSTANGLATGSMAPQSSLRRVR